MPDVDNEALKTWEQVDDEKPVTFERHAKIYAPAHAKHVLIDERSAKAAEVQTIVDRLPLGTQLGRFTTYARLVEGAPYELVRLRQQLIYALATRPDVRKKLVDHIEAYGKHEQQIADFLGGEFSGGRSVYKVTRERREVLQGAVLGIAETLRDLEGEFDLEFPVNPAIKEFSSKSPELKPLFAKRMWIRTEMTYDDNDRNWLGHPRVTQIERNASFDHPTLIRGPYRFRRFSSYRALAMLAATDAWFLHLKDWISAGYLLLLAGFYYTSGIKEVVDSTLYLPQYVKALANSDALPIFAEALGEADMLCAAAEILSSQKVRTCLPYISCAPEHRFLARGLRNPIVALSEDGCVSNDVDFHGMTFVTGLNSGGKSTLSKAFVENQLFAQSGLPVFADFAVVSFADRVAYVPSESPEIDDGDGRLGFDFQRIQPVLYSATPRTVVLIDDCVSGTTFAESLNILNGLMQGFSKIGGTTIFATHLHELVSQFQAADDGQFLMMERDGEKPTFKVVPGVSAYSAAERVAEKYELDHDSITALMKKRGADPSMREINLSELRIVETA
jgi:hypothetical protein